MILADKPLDVVTSGVKSNTFGIALNRKMFRILSADLYSDKIRAVIRELSTNAADAHVAAGKRDEPFNVHLPNNFEPWFEVRDNGTGLSAEQMTTVYTQYGVSDKTNSNDFTGCLGLGSKSPFAYTDSFTVESRHNGVKTVYTAYLNEHGFPALSEPMTQDATDEPNGLSVKFPVKASDFYAFRDKAQETLKWFKVRPTVTGNKFTYPDRPEFIHQTEKFGLPKSRTGNSYVVMGNVAYPVTTSQIANRYSSADEQIRALLDWGVEIYVNIGDVDFTAAREALSYDDDADGGKRTVPFIRAACTDAVKVLGEFVTKDIASKATLWEARTALYDIRHSFHGFNFTAQWNGQTITDKVTLPNGVNGTPSVFCETFRRKNYRGERLTVTRSRTSDIHADGTKVFIIDSRGGYAAVRRALEDKDHGARVHVFAEDTDAAWLKETGLDAIVVKTSTLPKPERTATTRTAAQKAKVYEFNGYNHKNAADSWTPVEFDLDDDGEFVFVEILYFNYRTKADAETQHPNGLKHLISMVDGVTGKSLKVYGIRPSDRANIIDKSEGTWTPLDEYMKRVREEAGAKNHRLAELAEQYDNVRASDWSKLGEQTFAPGSKFGEFANLLTTAKDAADDRTVKAYRRLYDATGGEDFPNGDALSNEKGEVEKTYPMLQHLNWSWRSDDKQFQTDVGDYIRAVDARVAVKADAA